MPLKPPTQLPALPPYATTLLSEPETLLQTLNIIVSALFGRTITDIDLAGSLAFQENPTAYTIASGVIDIEEGSGQNTASRSAIAVDTESAAATDDLDTIDGGRDGMMLILRAADDTHSVVVKNGTGNIVLPDDIPLDSYDKVLFLVYNSTLSKWLSWKPPAEGFLVVTKTGAYTASIEKVILVDATGGAVTITLPTVASSNQRIYYIKKIDASANVVTIDGNASETIDGATTRVLALQWDSILVVCNGSAWYII